MVFKLVKANIKSPVEIENAMLECSICGKQFSVEKLFSGNIVICPKCGTRAVLSHYSRRKSNVKFIETTNADEFSEKLLSLKIKAKAIELLHRAESEKMDELLEKILSNKLQLMDVRELAELIKEILER